MSRWRPPYPYIPGQTPRHPEGLFDGLTGGVTELDPAELPESAAWQAGFEFLAEGYFWEAHEVLEALWNRCPPNSPERLFVQSLIQHANAGLKERMNRPNATRRLRQAAEVLWTEAFARSGGKIFGRTAEERLW